jgi:hypothetical protein
MQKLVRLLSLLVILDIYACAVVCLPFHRGLGFSGIHRSAVGARNFLFLNVPRVDLTPLVQSLFMQK